MSLNRIRPSPPECSCSAITPSVAPLDLNAKVGGWYILLALPGCLLALLALANRMTAGELAKRLVLVRGRLTGLIDERSQRLHESEAFYASREWKRVREAVIQDQGLVCRGCSAG